MERRLMKVDDQPRKEERNTLQLSVLLKEMHVNSCQVYTIRPDVKSLLLTVN